jgi:hydroxyacylglutathione hydrolase
LNERSLFRNAIKRAGPRRTPEKTKDERHPSAAKLYWTLVGISAGPRRTLAKAARIDNPSAGHSFMTMSVHQYLCLTDNYGALVHDSTTGRTACVDAPEARPTLAALAERGWNLSDVLITHHHADHIQGVPELKTKFPALKVWGPAKDSARIPFLDNPVAEGDYARVGSIAAKIIETPGHTLGHITYYFEEDEIAFCGDTLFSLGCGRAFETPYAVLWSSLVKLASLPGETQLYCGHEYTEANGRFAATIEPDNPILQARIDEVARLRAARRPTLPTTVAAELAANPFLRVEEPAVQAAVGMKGADPAAIFAEIRARKDRF